MNSDHRRSISTFPDRFEFYYGSFSGASVYIRKGDSGGLLVERAAGGNFDGAPLQVYPLEKDWLAFWNLVEDLGVWGWDPEYLTAHGCCGVTYWHLSLEQGSRSIISRGSNAYPGGHGPEPSPLFIRFLDALELLTGTVFR